MCAGQPFESINIQTTEIKLDSFLKWAGVAVTGGQAKLLVEEGYILVNGKPENRRGRKLAVGDLVEVRGSGTYKVVRET